VPVYSVRRLLGYSLANESARWLLLAAPGHSAAFAFEQFEGYSCVSRSEILPTSGGATRAHLSEVARVKDEPRPVVSLRSVLEALRDRSGLVGIHKEQ
jgi:purine-binding chemotaxis protein CheW